MNKIMKSALLSGFSLIAINAYGKVNPIKVKNEFTKPLLVSLLGKDLEHKYVSETYFVNPADTYTTNFKSIETVKIEQQIPDQPNIIEEFNDFQKLNSKEDYVGKYFILKKQMIGGWIDTINVFPVLRKLRKN